MPLVLLILGGEKSLIYFPTHDAVSQNQELHLFVEPEWEESEIMSDEREAPLKPVHLFCWSWSATGCGGKVWRSAGQQ